MSKLRKAQVIQNLDIIGKRMFCQEWNNVQFTARMMFFGSLAPRKNKSVASKQDEINNGLPG